ncbi:DUF2135 domain-containing protein [Stenotrophomonas sp. S48]|uniref:VIT domain-containing protein n=1 Tax=unclassified Stenotrophomonas TaxID=196198 RepID=UPI0018FF28A2|nr:MULTISPECIES: VIT domain-containing protein [unclassified Stenotrophomonas]MBK0026935.1 DUF2135 domain-containing protein [Stenotrophomonas sp. S48]MBK0048872.1 DUF2135 domain-containing protein [Stenotrophomonas sp. S49]
MPLARCVPFILLVLAAWSADAQSPGIARPQPSTPLLVAPAAGQPIQLRQARIEGEVQAGIAQTRITLEFHNPNRRVLEGELQFPLADGQQISGFALDIDGELREAVPVPKDRGRQVFEEIARRGVDPGLLEQTAGNQFRLRIYPLPAGGSRRVQLVVREPLAYAGNGWQWALPLQFAAGAASVELKLQAPGEATAGTAPFRIDAGQLHWQGRGAQLPAQLQWTLPAARRAQVQVANWQDGHYLLAQLPVATSTTPRTLPRDIGLLWDGSGSAGQRDRTREFALLDHYFAAMGDGTVVLTVLRDRPEPERRFRIRKGDWSALRQALQAVRPDGASALAQWQPQPGVQEYLLVSDGLLTYGPEALPALAEGQRLFAISSAGARTDSTRLRGWSQAHGGRFVAVGTDVGAAARELLSAPLDVQIDAGRGVQDVVIDRRSEAQGWLWLHARLAADGVPMRVRVAGSDWQALPGSTRSDDGALLAGLWAQAQLQQLALDRRSNREAMQRLSQQFGLVGPDTSLIVLETLDDYLRYAIRPSGALRAGYDARFAKQVADRQAEDRRRLDAVAAQWKERQQWWNRRWPKTAPSAAGNAKEIAQNGAVASAPMALLAAPAPAAPPPPPAPMAPARARRQAPAAEAMTLDAMAVATDDAGGAAAPANRGQLGIRLAAWQPDSDVARRLRQGPPAQLYDRYLAERDAHADSSAFFLDVADLLLAQGQRELALRVLSNLAEMELDNRHLLRVLGYRLMQADAPALAVPVFEQVLAMGQEEPQSFRDLGLALAAAGKPQQALDPLYQVVVRRWDSRFNGVALIALDELTNLVARSRPALDTQGIDPRLLQAMPLDLRVVLAWDADNSDMDLWVTDPNGERAYYGNRLTWQGGQMSQDFTGGYGPEQFSLRNAKPGKYKVEANYFGSRQQLVTGATTLMLRLTTHWGTPQQKDQRVTLRLKDRADTILVGEFEVQ